MRVFWFLIIICIPIVIIFSNLLLLIFNQRSYFNIFEKTSVYRQIDRETSNQAAKELIGYFKDKNNLDHNYYSNQAILHLKDVKKLINLVEVSALISTGILLISSSCLVIKKKLHLLKNAFLTGAIATFIISSIFAILLVFSFQNAFILFHKIAFTNGLWLFDESDNLIKLFPIAFFAAFCKKLLINIIATSVVISTISFVSLKK